MSKKRLFGLGLVIFSLIIILSNISITGAAIGDYKSNALSFISILMFAVGIFLLMQKEGNLARITLENGAIISDPKKLQKIARKMDYSGKEVKEGYQILSQDGKPLTVIPRHKVSVGVYKNIMNALASGESSFRRYNN